MNRSNVSGPSRSIAARMRSTSRGSPSVGNGGGSASGRRPASNGSIAIRSRRRSGGRRVRRASGRPAGPGSRRWLPTPSRPPARGRPRGRVEQVRREPRTESGPRRLVRPGPIGQQHPTVDERRVAELGEPGPERVRPVPVEEHAEDRPGAADRRSWGRGEPRSRERSLGERARGPQPALLDEGPDAAAGVPLEPADGRGGGPTGHDELRARVLEHATDRIEPAVDPVCRRSQHGRDQRGSRQRRDRTRAGPPSGTARPGGRRAANRGPSPAASAHAGPRPRSRRPRPASGAGRCRPGSRTAGPRARPRPTRTAPRRPPRSGCWPATRRSSALAARTNARRSAAVASGMAPDPRRTRPRSGRRSSTSAWRRVPNGRSSGSPDTIRTVAAPARPNPSRCSSARWLRASASARSSGPASGAGSGWRMMTSTAPTGRV